MSMHLGWLMVGCIVMLLTPLNALAQDPSETQIKTKTPEPTRLYFGMWTEHLKRPGIALDNNWLVGLAHRGFFGATFKNSFGRRAFTAGYQRALISSSHGLLTTSLGFRVGAVTGYDGRFMRLARDLPVLPLISAYGNVDVGRVGVEVAYTFVVVSVAVSYRLGG